MTGIEEERRELFFLLKSQDTRQRFWERVADDVDWTVEGTHPLAGRYRSKADFVSATFARMTDVFREPATLALERLHLAGDWAIAELRFVARTKDGGLYDNPAAGSAASTVSRSSRYAPTWTRRWSHGR